MRLLAIDTGSDACSVAVANGDRVVVRSEIVGRGHAEILFELIARALAEGRLAVSDLDRIAVTVGPGSFTGVRVGVAAARGLALALGQPAIGIGTLAVHAEEARALAGAHPVLAVLAAGRSELYGAVYAADGSELAPPRAATAEGFAALARQHLAQDRGDLVLAGSGADDVLATLASPLPVAHRHAVANVSALARLATIIAPATASPAPLYLRAPDAKPQSAAALPHRP
jgi:tRNA threonylcarbamoyladenosine biosynthesis protein TsaB